MTETGTTAEILPYFSPYTSKVWSSCMKMHDIYQLRVFLKGGVNGKIKYTNFGHEKYTTLRH